MISSLFRFGLGGGLLFCGLTGLPAKVVEAGERTFASGLKFVLVTMMKNLKKDKEMQTKEEKRKNALRQHEKVLALLENTSTSVTVNPIYRAARIEHIKTDIRNLRKRLGLDPKTGKIA